VEHCFVQVIETAGYLRLLFFFGQGIDNIKDFLCGPGIISSHLFQEFFHTGGNKN
jgi:hypothetical protein